MHSGRDLRRLLGQFARATLYRVKFVIIFIMSLKDKNYYKTEALGQAEDDGLKIKGVISSYQRCFI
jgi:hypothetical protein